ncbi:MAG TPA: hypothetical protein VK625_08760 [Flavitalea sp.]|nr:hypothetical protein [Flavitalea sp.]
MKKPSILAGTLLLSFLIFGFVACQKIWDHIPHEPHEHDNTCRIKTAVFGDITYTFYYNSHGNPDSIVPTGQSDTAYSFRYFFKYDEAGRLAEQLTIFLPFELGSFYAMHKYEYTNNQITLDSTMRSVLFETWVYRFEYDNQGRISKETKSRMPTGTNEEPVVEEIAYVYNADGNLLPRPGSPGQPDSTYDDKTSLASINKIWQFISRDYSKNNREPALAYNSEGLPLSFPEPYLFLADYDEKFGPSGFPIEQATYDCGESSD